MSAGGADVSQERYERERAFHDHRFGSGEARPADRFYVVNGPAEADYRARVLAAPAGTTALEYGCGTGSLAFALAAAGVETLGIDISPVAVAAAEAEASAREVKGARFAVMNAEALDLDDASVDLVAGSGILHHLDLGVAAAELARVLRPGGRAVFLEPLGHNPAINLYRRLTPGMRTPDEHPLLRTDFAALRASFGRVAHRPYGLTTLAALPLGRSARLPVVLDRLTALDRHLFRRVPRLGDHAWTVIVELARPIAAPGHPEAGRPR